MLLSNIGRALANRGYYLFGNARASWLGVGLGRGARVSPRADIRRVAWIGAAAIASEVRIGPGTYIGSGSVDSGMIGAYCSIGHGVLVGPTEHDMSAWTMSPFMLRDAGLRDEQATRAVRAPRIGSDVWIGSNTVILRGTAIGDGAVIGAGSVVKGIVHAYEVWAGVPARRIRARFRDAAEREAVRVRLDQALRTLGINPDDWCLRDAHLHD
jgi:acetyltransferase-like isoleucine patch superfamily enzyme